MLALAAGRGAVSVLFRSAAVSFVITHPPDAKPRPILFKAELSFRLYAFGCDHWNEFREGKRAPASALRPAKDLASAAGCCARRLRPDAERIRSCSPPRADTPVAITLDDAIRLAQASEPGYAAAKAASQSADLDRSIARAGLLPSARLYNQDIYTQPNGIYAEGGEGVSTPNPKFVANDSRPREYIAQGIAEENLSVAGFAGVRHADAAAAMASAEQEIARRGLVVAVTTMFFSSLAADHKLAVAEQARQEAADFTRLTTQREQAREAHTPT